MALSINPLLFKNIKEVKGNAINVSFSFSQGWTVILLVPDY